MPPLPTAPLCSRWLAGLCAALLVSCGGEVALHDPTFVERSERTWVDLSRTTPPTSTYAGAPQRTLRVLIWQPVTAGRLPLLVMAHGFGGSPDKFDAFARTVAAAGFVVAAPAFPLTNEAAPGGHDAGLRDYVHQAADISFVITQLVQTAAESRLPFAIEQIAVLGHSLGGTTVIGLTRKNCCHDPRVRATILVAAPLFLVNGFGPDPIAADGPPTLVMQGTADGFVNYSNAGQIYDLIDPPRFLVGLRGAGHSEAVESQAAPPIAARAAAQQATIAFLNAVFRSGNTALDETLGSLAAAGDVIQAQPGT